MISNTIGSYTGNGQQDHLPSSTSMTVDLSNGYSFPTHIAATDLRLDIVWWNDDQKTHTLVELCNNLLWNLAVSMTKEDRYHDLIDKTQKAGYTSTLITIEVGSRGLPNMSGFQRLCDILKLCHPEFCKLLLDTSQQAILGSYKIWYSRNNTFTWSLLLVHMHMYFYVWYVVFVDRAQAVIVHNVQFLCKELWQSALGSPSPHWVIPMYMNNTIQK